MKLLNIRGLSIGAALLTMLAAGCQVPLQPNQYELRMKSIPSGALIYSASGKALGMAPYEGVMTLTPAQAASESLTDEAIVVWPSGATLRQKIIIRPRENRIWNVTFSRPVAAPNLDLDLRHAANQAQMQSAASAEADVSSLMSTFAASYAAGRYQAIAPSLPPPSSVRCTARNAGWAVVTDCRQAF